MVMMKTTLAKVMNKLDNDLPLLFSGLSQSSPFSVLVRMFVAFWLVPEYVLFLGKFL